MSLTRRVSATKKCRCGSVPRVLLGALLAVALLFGSSGASAGTDEPKVLEKVVISDIVFSSECPGSTRDYINTGNRDVPLRQQLNARFPRDVLAARGRGLEDIGDYKEVSKWNPEVFTVRNMEHLKGVLNQFNIKYLIRLTVMCDPATRKPSIMSAAMTGLDDIDQILKCPPEKRGAVNERTICNAWGGIFDAVAYTSVPIDETQPSTDAFGKVLMHLLHVPEVQFGTTLKKADPGEMLSLPFLVAPNDGTENGYNGPKATPRKYHVEQDVVQLPQDLSERICAAPDEYWRKLTCKQVVAAEGEECDAADDVEFEARSLVHGKTRVSLRSAMGGDRIEFRMAGYPTSYLVRAQAFATEKDEKTGAVTRVPSAPVYECIHSRWRDRFLNMSLSVGVANDLKTLLGMDTVTYPAATLVKPAVSLSLAHLWTVDTLAYLHPFVPTSRVGIGLGFSFMGGLYPCTTGDTSECGSPGGFTRHSTMALAVELKVVGESDLFVWKRLSLRILSEAGVGSDWTTSTPAFAMDGFHFIFSGAVGVGISLLNPNSVGRAYDQTLGILWQVRSRLPPAVTFSGAGAEALGVPDGVDTLSFNYRFNWSQ